MDDDGRETLGVIIDAELVDAPTRAVATRTRAFAAFRPKPMRHDSHPAHLLRALPRPAPASSDAA